MLRARKRGDETPWGTPIAIFPTPERSAFRFSFHERGRPEAEPTSGHTIILGRPGSGKSVLLQEMCAALRGADLVLLNAGDLTYGIVRLDETSRQVAAAHLSTLPDDLDRGAVWTASANLSGAYDQARRSCDGTSPMRVWGPRFAKRMSRCHAQFASGRSSGPTTTALRWPL